MTALERLRHLMQPSSMGTFIDWDDIAVAYGTRFPSDYRNFLSVYGSGEIDGMLAVFAPSVDPYAPSRHTSRLPADVLDLPEVNEWNDPLHAELYGPADIMVWGRQPKRTYWAGSRATTNPAPGLWLSIRTEASGRSTTAP